MDVPTALLAHLAELAVSIGADVESLQEPLKVLLDNLSTAVPSYCGMQLTVTDGGQPVTLTAWPTQTETQVSSSLHIPLNLFGPTADSDSHAIFYAYAPGAFINMASDLGLALNSSRLILDAHLPPRLDGSGLTGLEEASAVNRAVGYLMDRGCGPDEAYERLRQAAARAGMELHEYATELLRWPNGRTHT